MMQRGYRIGDANGSLFIRFRLSSTSGLCSVYLSSSGAYIGLIPAPQQFDTNGIFMNQYVLNQDNRLPPLFFIISFIYDYQNVSCIYKTSKSCFNMN